MNNHDADDKITAVCSSLTGNQIAIGTLRGRVYFRNRFDGSNLTKFEPHEKKITQVAIRDSNSVITSSNDGTIHIQSLKNTVPSRRISPKEYEISCFCSIDPLSDNELIIGLGKGDLIYYKEQSNTLVSLISSQKVIKKNLYKDTQQEGSIISCLYYKKVLAWSTSKHIRLRYYPNFTDDKQMKNICSIEYPANVPQSFPGHLTHQGTTMKPSIVFMKSKQLIDSPNEKNICLIVGWSNQVKIIELTYDDGMDKYSVSSKTRKTINREDIFLAGGSFFEVQGSKSKYLTL